MLELSALHAGIDRLRQRALQLRLGLHDVDLRGDARRVAIAGELERLVEGGHGVAEQLLLRVQHPQLEIARSELGLRREARRREIRRARLGVRRARFKRTAQAPPQIDFPGGIERHGAVVADRARRAAARDRGVGVERREKRGARLGREGLRLAEPRFGEQHVLIGEVDACDQRGELRIAEDLPPVAAARLIARLGGFPPHGLLVRGGNHSFRVLVIGSDRASSERERKDPRCASSPHRPAKEGCSPRPARRRLHHRRKRSR